MMNEHTPLLKNAILDADRFVQATFGGTQRGYDQRWQKLTIRPVMLKDGRHLQFSWYDAKQNFVYNHAGGALAEALDEALALPFASFSVQTTEGDLNVQITKKGKAILHRHKSRQPRAVDLMHDRQKQTVLREGHPEPFLQAVGIMTPDGKIRAGMHSKFTQINEFLRLLDETSLFDSLDEQAEPLRVVDCGCGNAYLTFATFHYLTQVKSLNVEMVGIDTNARLIDANNRRASELGWADSLMFIASPIEAYQPEIAPDVVIALHACDTATDDALALGIRSQSRLIVAAPCCHHDLQAQLEQGDTPQPFGEVLRYGLFHQRMGDLLTDSLRALILRRAGYKVDVIDFVGTEHTPKNLMLRAVRTSTTNDPRLEQEYDALKSYWGITPYLEGLLN
jgi:SAM-dependent methyltransferase